MNLLLPFKRDKKAAGRLHQAAVLVALREDSAAVFFQTRKVRGLVNEWVELHQDELGEKRRCCGTG